MTLDHIIKRNVNDFSLMLINPDSYLSVKSDTIKSEYVKRKIKLLDIQIAKAVENDDFDLAIKLKSKKEAYSHYWEKIDQLHKEANLAVEAEDYDKAIKLKGQITSIIDNYTQLKQLEKEKSEAVAAEDFDKAHQLKLQIEAIENGETYSSISNEESKGKSQVIINNPQNKINKNTFEFEADYRRSSLHTMLIQDPDRLYANVIDTTFLNARIPEKFNNHLLNERTINITNSENTFKKDNKTDLRLLSIKKYLTEHDIAKKLVAKWFNRSPRGTFNTDLIAQRGFYDADNLDVEFAKATKRGLTILADAGEDLIHNTFVLVSDFRYINKEEVADKTNNILSLVGDVASAAGYDDVKKLTDGTQVAITVAGKGYVVVSYTYLFRLSWNDSISSVFYEEYWMDDNSYSRSRKEAFDNSDIFTLEYVGYSKAWADLQSTIFTSKSEEELISMATIRAMDKVIAKLQKNYEVFRTKTPLISVDPLAAKIGLKEGITKKSTFEVLEQYIDKNGLTRYKRKGIIHVNPKYIWDNRYMASEENEIIGVSNQANYTQFYGPKNKFYKGMLIRQIK